MLRSVTRSAALRPAVPIARRQAGFAGFDANKPTVAVIGTGWAGAYFLKTIDPKKFNIMCVSQRNHMIFTPLLPQTCTGTLEFRSVCEPILRVQPALAHKPNSMMQALAYDVDFDRKAVQCVSVGVIGAQEKVPVQSFEFNYDYLVLAHGARPNTFNIPGVEENAFFLREVTEARGIRRRLAQNIQAAALPTTTREEAARLLHVVIVGGGPTGVEFAGDLSDFLRQDLPKLAPALRSMFRITIVEAAEVLGTFDKVLREHGQRTLKKEGIVIKKAVVAEVRPNQLSLRTGETLNCGLIVWSTGVGPSSLSKTLKCDKTKQGRIAIDDHCQALKNGIAVPEVFALGDCAANVDAPLPTLAAVASRQAEWLAKTMNKTQAKKVVVSQLPPFVYKSLGSMVSVGHSDALVSLTVPTKFNLKGLHAFFLWRSVYFSLLISMRLRFYVAVNWLSSRLFGRDTTYIGEISETKLWKALAKEGADKEQARRRVIAAAAANRVPLDESSPAAKTAAAAAAAAVSGASSEAKKK
jgi:NADH dehydrogenase